jgi:hemerythrin-like metal-binding protein
MADCIPWFDYYNIGIESIDEQHRELFRMFNRVCDAVWDGQGRESVQDFLNFLAEYAQTHFSNEEFLMQRNSFPGYETHKLAHDALVAEVSAFLAKYATEDIASAHVVKVITALGEWTRNHIRSVDRELGAFLKEQEAVGAVVL